MRVWGNSARTGWLFLMARQLSPICGPRDATQNNEEARWWCPAAAPHGEAVHVHIGAGSLLCRPRLTPHPSRGYYPDQTASQTGKKETTKQDTAGAMVVARLRCGAVRGMVLIVSCGAR